MEGTGAEALATLVGRELASVVFVRGYLQLHFDGPILTVVSTPVLRARDMDHPWGSPEFCNLLLSCISRPVASTFVQEGDRLSLGFDNGCELSVSLRPEHYRTAEAVTFTPEERGMMWIW